MNPHISHLLCLNDFKWHKMTKSYLDAKLGKKNKFSLEKEVLQMCPRLLTHQLPRCLGKWFGSRKPELSSLKSSTPTWNFWAYWFYTLSRNNLVELNSQKLFYAGVSWMKLRSLLRDCVQKQSRSSTGWCWWFPHESMASVKTEFLMPL